MMTLWIFLKGAITTDSLVVAIVGYLVVFASLVLLFVLFNTLPKLIYHRIWKIRRKRGKDVPDKPEIGVSGETTAAISMALHLYFSELHDEESGVLTIKKVSKAYSPWSSKIYAVRNQFNRR
ncbi:MAG: OadG family protein [Bacteroidales bacterium]|jgi:Na+-transporting methylmalonyl-CoA/oxaloacetate decarboxylase gamma subunit|nr:OadG family protein [Bacteroidales bacterium]